MSTQQDSLIKKIRALRAKANDKSVTEAEAALFAAKVQELLAAHGLSITDLGSDQVEEEKIGGQSHKWDGSPARQVMFRSVCLFYMCTAVGPGRKGDPWTIVGRPTNVMVALDMFDYLLKTVIRMSNEYARLNPGANKIDWRRGCMTRLAERLREMHAAEKAKPQERRVGGGAANLPALVVDEGRAVKSWMSANMHTQPGRATSIKHGADAARGRSAADGISLHRQVGGGSGRLMIGKR
jgi:hypothetical protein